MSALPPSGTLTSQPLPRLLLVLRREGFTGALALRRGARETRVLLREGVPVQAEAGGGGLAERLARAGRLPADAPARVAEHAAARGVPESAALLQLGLLPPRELLAALRDDLRERLLEAAAWLDGDYRLDPGAPVPDTGPLRVDPLELAREGLARHFRPEQLLAALMARVDRYPQAGRGLRALRERLADDEAAMRLLEACDGSLSLGALLEQATGVGALSAAWIADAAGVLDWRDAPVAREKPEPEPADDAVEISFEGEVREDAGRAARTRAGEAAGSAASASDAGGLRRELLERHARLDELDHYALLGVGRDADTAAIRRAYTTAAKRFHPDALASLGLSELRDPATAMFGRIARAYATLSDMSARRDYDAELAGETPADGERAVNAESLYRKAEVMLRMGDFNGALRFLRSAVGLVPDDPAYRSALGWALHKKNPPESQAAREHLQKALAAAPNDAKAHFRLGVVLRALGDAKTAERHHARARQLDPKEDGR
jgi:Flp pilus assembly protein TadD